MLYKIDAKQHRSRLGRYRTYQPFGVGIFFAYRFGFMRVCGEWCGLRRRRFGAVKVRVLSLGADSLCESVLWIWVEVREWFLIKHLKSMAYLRTDRASFSVALGSKGNCSEDRSIEIKIARHSDRHQLSAAVPHITGNLSLLESARRATVNS